MTNPVVVRCTCQGAPHQTGDRFKLFDPLPFPKAILARQSVAALFADDEQPSEAEMTATLMEVFLLHCVQAWNRTDAKRKALPLSRANLRTFMDENPVEAAVVADAANDLYIDKVVLPLLQAALRSSQPTPTEPSTSARTGSRSKSRKPSSPSSTTNTLTDVTEPTSTSLDGDSSTSRRSASAA